MRECRPIGVDDRLSRPGLDGRRRPRRATGAPDRGALSSRCRRAGSISAGGDAAVFERREQRRCPLASTEERVEDRAADRRRVRPFQSTSSRSATLGSSVVPGRPRPLAGAPTGTRGRSRPTSRSRSSAFRRPQWPQERHGRQPLGLVGRIVRDQRGGPPPRARANGLSRSSASGVLARSRASSRPASAANCQGA